MKMLHLILATASLTLFPAKEFSVLLVLFHFKNKKIEFRREAKSAMFILRTFMPQWKCMERQNFG